VRKEGLRCAREGRGSEGPREGCGEGVGPQPRWDSGEKRAGGAEEEREAHGNGSGGRGEGEGGGGRAGKVRNEGMGIRHKSRHTSLPAPRDRHRQGNLRKGTPEAKKCFTPGPPSRGMGGWSGPQTGDACQLKVSSFRKREVQEEISFWWARPQEED